MHSSYSFSLRLPQPRVARILPALILIMAATMPGLLMIPAKASSSEGSLLQMLEPGDWAVYRIGYGVGELLLVLRTDSSLLVLEEPRVTAKDVADEYAVALVNASYLYYGFLVESIEGDEAVARVWLSLTPDPTGGVIAEKKVVLRERDGIIVFRAGDVEGVWVFQVRPEALEKEFSIVTSYRPFRGQDAKVLYAFTTCTAKPVTTPYGNFSSVVVAVHHVGGVWNGSRVFEGSFYMQITIWETSKGLLIAEARAVDDVLYKLFGIENIVLAGPPEALQEIYGKEERAPDMIQLYNTTIDVSGSRECANPGRTVTIIDVREQVWKVPLTETVRFGPHGPIVEEEENNQALVMTMVVVAVAASITAMTLLVIRSRRQK